MSAASRAESAQNVSQQTPVRRGTDHPDEVVPVSACVLDDPGHRAHWMPSSRTLFGSQTPNAIGSLGERQGWFIVDREDGVTAEMWHHDSGWLNEIFGDGPRAVSWVPGTSFITVTHAGGLTFLYADSQETPCRSQITTDMRPTGPRRRI